MADFGAPVAQNVDISPAKGVATISGILGLKQQQLALQTGEFQKETAKAGATTADIEAKGKTEAAGFLKDFDFANHIGPDGTLDMNAALSNPKFIKAGPGKELIANALLGIKNNQIKNKQDMASLNNSVVTAGARMFGDLVSDPDVIAGNDKGLEKINAHGDVFREMYPDQGPAFIDKFLGVMNSGHIKPQDRAQALRALQLQGEDVSSQQQQQNPVLGAQVGPNGELAGTAQNRVTGAMTTAAGGVPLGMSPAQLAEAVTLPNGQVTTKGALLRLLGQGQGGGPRPAGPTQTGAPMPPGAAPQGAPKAQSPFLNPGGHPRTAEQDAPPPNAPAQVQQQFAASVKNTTDYVDQVRAGDEQYGTNMAVNTAIRNLLKGGVKTGPGTQQWHNVLGALGAPADLNNVSDYQQLGAWLDRQAAGMRGTLGLPATNAGQAASETISGSTNYQPEAIAAKNNFNQALVEGLHQQRQGLDRVAGYSGNPSPSAVGAYRAAWANNFDPLVHEYKAAKKRGDADQVKAIIGQLTPQQAQALAKKGKNLDRLEKAEGPL